MKILSRLAWVLLTALAVSGCLSQPKPRAVDPEFLGELERAGFDLSGDESAVSRSALLAGMPATPELRWYDYELPAGKVGSINIDWLNRNGAAINIVPADTFLRDLNGDGRPDYDGIRFRGRGVDVTTVECTSWDGITLAVKRGRFKVRLENLTIVSGYERGTAFGEQNLDGDFDQNGKLIPGTQRLTAPEFELQLENVRAVVLKPPAYGASGASIVAPGKGYKNNEIVTVVGGDGRATKLRLTVTRDVQTGAELVTALSVAPGENGTYTLAPPSPATVTGGSGSGLTVSLAWRRAKWMWFAYNADLRASNVRTEAAEAVEHGYYWHGFAKYGAKLEDCYTESGAEGFKVRPDRTEVAYWGGESWIELRRCTFRDWFRDWSWRGGAAVVIQGGASHVWLERVWAYCGSATGSVGWNERSKAFMVSSEGNAYGHGSKDSSFGNGFVVISQCASSGGSLVDWRNTMLYVAKNSGGQMAARGLLVEKSGFFGPKLIATFSSVPAGRIMVRDCNTATIADFCSRVLGMVTSPEVTIPTSSRRIPLSEGFVR